MDTLKYIIVYYHILHHSALYYIIVYCSISYYAKGGLHIPQRMAPLIFAEMSLSDTYCMSASSTDALMFFKVF